MPKKQRLRTSQALLPVVFRQGVSRAMRFPKTLTACWGRTSTHKWQPTQALGSMAGWPRRMVRASWPPSRQDTPAAAHALVPVKLGQQHAGPLQALQGGCLPQGFFPQIAGQAFEQVVDDPVSILHHRCGHLNVVGSQQEEFHCVPPGLNPPCR